MLFLNISTDLVIIEINKETIKLDRQEIENIMGPTLVRLYKKHNFKNVLLLNGPGGFTNLRVGTLAINLLNTLENGNIDIFSISKIDFFNYFVKKGLLPNKGIIYIGQKKNVWLYDFKKGNYDTIKKDEINYKDELFFDLVYEKEYFETKTINICLKDNEIILNYNGKELKTDIRNLKIKPEKIVEAKYFIQPIMGNQGQ